MMREYYFLFELEGSQYNLSSSEGLHLAATGRLPSYVYVHDQIYLTELEQGLVLGADSFYLRIPESSLRTIEKWVISRLHSADQSSNQGAEPPKKFKLKEIFVDVRYSGKLPGNPMPYDYSHPEVNPTPLHISNPDLTSFQFSPSELIFWTEDLDALVRQGLVQRFKSNSDQERSIDAERQEYPPHLEALVIAWRKYWKNADRSDRSTCPKKDDVEAWLIGQGLSQKTASAGATIIKPQWANDKGW